MDEEPLQHLGNASMGGTAFQARHPGRLLNMQQYRRGDDLILRLVEIAVDAPWQTIGELRLKQGDLPLALDGFREFAAFLDVAPEIRDNLNAGLPAITDEMVDRYREGPPTSTGDEGGDPQA